MSQMCAQLTAHKNARWSLSIFSSEFAVIIILPDSAQTMKGKTERILVMN